ncbi:MAG: pilus assembly protein PilM [Planctomycetales bacterium]|nr:pilus assembly protein PilM [Planctomycetales bacterium]
MVSLPLKTKYGPIGVDIGSRSLKLVQFDAERRKIVEAVRWDLPADLDCLLPDEQSRQLTEAIRAAREGRRFRGKAAVVCLGGSELFVQNIRIAKGPEEDFERLVFQETAGRLPFPVNEAEARFINAADVRQGDSMRREVIVMAAHQPAIDQRLIALVDAGLKPIAVDAEPVALVRCYVSQFRRDEDHSQRAMFVHVGATRTAIIIAEGAHVLFCKYVDVGGSQMDEALSRSLDLETTAAASLRRHNGDRRADLRDPDVQRSVRDAVRPVLEQLASELAMCVRYHSVTFRGKPLVRVVIGGGEASEALVESITESVGVPCELGDPLRSYECPASIGRKSQWDVATGLALRGME